MVNRDFRIIHTVAAAGGSVMGRRGDDVLCVVVVYLLIVRADADIRFTAACHQLCFDKNLGDVDLFIVIRCALDCGRLAPLNALEDRGKQKENNGEKFTRTNRLWFLPDTSKWQARMLKPGIWSRSRSAGAYLRIGRRSTDPPSSVDRRGGRQCTAGLYLRIGRAGESADREMMASGTEYDGRPEENLVNLLHLRKVNRDAGVDHEAMQLP